MSDLNNINFDFVPFWTWFLLYLRMLGLFSAIPGIGTNSIPIIFRNSAALVIALTIVLTGLRAAVPDTLALGGLMLVTEFLAGYIIGLIPSIIIGGVTVAGQVTTGAVGLGQANMIDPSLGESIAVLARIESFIATAIFLAIDGHHLLFRAAAGLLTDLPLGLFRPDGQTAAILLDRFVDSFQLAVLISAPILVTLLVTNFVLGLITKFIPQVNIFIISLPLTILVGLYIVSSTIPGFAGHIVHELETMERTIGSIFTQ